jgi:hypothetical protein
MNIPDSTNPWFEDFKNNPNKAIAGIFTGGANLGILSAGGGESALYNWLQVYHDYPDFVHAVDESIAVFIEDMYGTDKFVDTENYLASIWKSVSVILLNFHLPIATKKFKEKVEENPEYLRKMQTGFVSSPYVWAVKALLTYDFVEKIKTEELN